MTAASSRATMKGRAPHRALFLAAAFSCSLSLSACKTADDPLLGKSVDSLMGQKAATEARLSTAAAEAIAQGKTGEALLHYEKLYKKSPRDRETAVNYAQLLRKTGQAQRAASVLAPFVIDKDGNDIEKAAPLALNEYAAAQIEIGNLERAQELLRRVVDNPKASDYHADAWHLTGVALDAQGQHKEAEKIFRASLENWRGNPTSVMNNLALSLASQGLFDESLLTLRQALVMAPDKQEIARNIEMVTTLRDAVVPKAPVSIK